MNVRLIILLFAILIFNNCTTNTNMTPILTTTVASQITANSAIAGGTLITDGGVRILEQGICWDTIPNPTITKNKKNDTSGKSIFTDTISGLKPNKTYYIRAFATNFTGTSYGKNETFTTLKPGSTSINTTAISAITETTATGGGNITSDGGSAITARGICWSTFPGATVTLTTKTIDGSGIGSFSSSLTGLAGSTTYYFRAYATNSLGTAYGEEFFFTTAPKAIVINVPVLFTNVVTSINYNSAITGGSITSDGGTLITSRGVCWSTNASPTITSGSITSNGTGFGSFTSSITGLSASTTYYVRAYATNAVGTAYGSELIFKTSAQPAIPILTTTAISAITATSATSGGSISADGGSPVTARGVCWSTSSGATVALSTKTSNGTGTGSFTSSITGLTGSTLYYVRAYATNAVGTAYGNEVTFTTSSAPLNSTGTLSVSVLTVAPGGGYAPKNVVAIWIETNAGVFVKSLLVYANARKYDLTSWYPNSSGNVVNATTGATQNSNTTRTCTWNGTDVAGNVVVDGTYLVCMNIADGRTAFASFPFVKGPTAVSLTPANVTGFSNISISWIH